MGLLKVIDDAPGYLKATFQGPQGSGKTYTAVKTAIVLHKAIESKKPIAFFDTESGSDYVVDLIKSETGIPPIRVKTRSFSDLLDVTKECLAGASPILIGDSISHVWRELQKSYMKKVNEDRRYPKTRLDIQDIMKIKELWEPWVDLYLNSALHIIICGREGNEWGSEENEETGKRELVQVGKKMKVEAEFGYEASLMVAMSSVQQAEGIVKKRDGKREKRQRAIINVATVLKDRFDVINGQTFEFPTGEEFLPHINRLNPLKHRPTDISVKSDQSMPDVDDNGWSREKKARVVLCEEIQGEITRCFPGQTAKEKACKSQVIEEAFATRSWTKVEGMSVDQLKQGLIRLKAVLSDIPALEARACGAVAA